MAEPAFIGLDSQNDVFSDGQILDNAFGFTIFGTESHTTFDGAQRAMVRNYFTVEFNQARIRSVNAKENTGCFRAP